MTPWPPIESLVEAPLDSFGPLTPSEVLYDFEGPCIFTAQTKSGATVLAYLSEDFEDEQQLRYLVATTSPATVTQLKTGLISVREALLRGSLWCVDFDYGRAPLRALSITPHEIPEDAMPESDTMLWSSLEPALTIRLKGDDIQEGLIPAAALTHAAEIAGRAFKPVFEWAAQRFRQDTNGRPPAWLRSLYAMPVQRVSFGSIEVAFAQAPSEADAQLAMEIGDASPPNVNEIRETAWSAVREGLDWAISQRSLPAGGDDEEKWTAILESMRRLAPASNGPVSSIEIWGSNVKVEAPRVSLDKKSAKRIRGTLTELKKRHAIQLRVLTGRVRDLDLDKLTFILRDIVDEPGEFALTLEDEALLETVHDAHYHGFVVNVVARSVNKGLWSATEIEFAASDEPDLGG